MPYYSILTSLDFREDPTAIAPPPRTQSGTESWIQSWIYCEDSNGVHVFFFTWFTATTHFVENDVEFCKKRKKTNLKKNDKKN